MLTRFQIGLPIKPPSLEPTSGSPQERIDQLERHVGVLAGEQRRLMEALQAMWDTLNRDGALDIVQARITASHGIAFPATANQQTDPNTLDDYEENTWTPALTFATPGNLSVAYLIQTGDYTKKGREVTANFTIVTSAFTHTTASGDLQITGLPFTSANSSNRFWPVSLTSWQGFTKAGYIINGRLASNSSLINFMTSTSGAGSVSAATTDFPTGGTVVLVGSVTYFV